MAKNWSKRHYQLLEFIVQQVFNEMYPSK